MATAYDPRRGPAPNTGVEFSDDFAADFTPDLPGPHVYQPVWLSVDDVKAWLRLNGQDTDDDDLLVAVSAMAEPYAQRCRPEWWQTGDQGPAYVPDVETYRGAVMYAAREYRRRNSPAGIEMFGDQGTSFVSRYDPDIDRALQTGPYAPPTIA